MYSDEEWNKMERYGALFLPAAGYRNAASVNAVNSSGYYWASTHFDENKAYLLYFYNLGSVQVKGDYRHYGCSVRLVKNK